MPSFPVQSDQAYPAVRLAGTTSLDAPALFPEPSPPLPAEAAGQAVLLDYSATGLSLRQHPLALLRPVLQAQGYDDTRRLAAARPGSRLRLPGLVLRRQRPGTAKGIVFVTVEDEFGQANLVVYADLVTRDRAALIGARLLLAEGRVERETEYAEVPIIHLICRKLIDRTDLLNWLMQAETGPACGDAAPPQARLPASRDFR